MLDENIGRVIVYTNFESYMTIARLEGYEFEKVGSSNHKIIKIKINILYLPVSTDFFSKKAVFTKYLKDDIPKSGFHTYSVMHSLYVQKEKNRFVAIDSLASSDNRSYRPPFSLVPEFYKLLYNLVFDYNATRSGLEVHALVEDGFNSLISKRLNGRESEILVYPIQKFGPSFGCGKAQLKIDKTICESRLISAMDLKMSQLYRARKNMQGWLSHGESPSVIYDEIVSSQKAWILRRNKKCNTSDIYECLINEYIERINILEKRGFYWDETFGRNFYDGIIFNSYF